MINGELPVENPATGEVFHRTPITPVDRLDAVFGTAQNAFRSWSGTDLDERRGRLSACADALSARVGEVAELLTREQGKPLADARAEVSLAAEWFRLTAGLSLAPERLLDGPVLQAHLTRVPYGVVGAIAPSNYPIILAITKVAPALFAGNCVVLKPSPLTPLSTLAMVQLLNETLPPGVLTTVVGGADVGEALVRNPGVGLVSFTGSIEVGRGIAAATATRFAHAVLELGGNDAAVVLPGCDPGQLADRLFWHAMRNSGQFCAAVKRLFVPRHQVAEFAEALGAVANKVVVGDGAEPGTQLGPLAAAHLAARVASLVDAAEAAGAKVYRGVAPDGTGHFYPPTIVSDLPLGTELELTEQFGPVLPVIGYGDIDEAVERANATEYGLGGSVWGDPAKAAKVADRLDCGTVWLNTHGELHHDMPFGGARSSGVGVEYGQWGLLEYTRIKVVASSSRGQRDKG